MKPNDQVQKQLNNTKLKAVPPPSEVLKKMFDQAKSKRFEAQKTLLLPDKLITCPTLQFIEFI